MSTGTSPLSDYDIGWRDYELGKPIEARDSKRSQGWKDAKEFNIQRWLNQFPRAESCEEKRYIFRYGHCHKVTFYAQGGFFTHTPICDAISHWLRERGITNFTLSQNFIIFGNKEDALICYLAFAGNEK